MFWAIVIVLLCICGMLLEVSATNLILAPILAPIAVAFGIGPIQFGLVLVFPLAMGQATPPFGTCLFVSCGLSGRTVGGISKQILLFVLVEIGRKNVCEHVSVRGSGADGGWREYFTAPASEVYKIDDSVDWKDAALVEPYAIGAHCTSRARIVPDDVVFILGTGTIGSIILQTCKAKGCKTVICCDIDDSSLARAKEYGADYVINFSGGHAIIANKGIPTVAVNGQQALSSPQINDMQIPAKTSVRLRAVGRRFPFQEPLKGKGHSQLHHLAS